VNGYLMGTVSELDGKTFDHLKVTVDGPEAIGSNEGRINREAYTDGSGWYGLAELPPGKYLVTIDLDKEAFTGEKARTVVIQAGRVAEVCFQ